MRFLSTETNENKVSKNKMKGILFCKAKEQRQMSLLGPAKSVNDVAKDTNEDKNEVHKHKIKGK